MHDSQGRRLLAAYVAGKGQRALAAAIGVSPATVNAWVHGRKRPDTTHRATLARVAGIAPSQWATDEELALARQAAGVAKEKLG